MIHPPHPIDVPQLLKAARQAAKNAYAPYSKFSVGAALLTKSGEIITGCNVENSSFGVTICAERNAAAQAIACGLREWTTMVIVSPSGVSPCGACRQFLAEFGPQLEIWFGHLDESKATVGPITIDALLPQAMRFPS